MQHMMLWSMQPLATETFGSVKIIKVLKSSSSLS